MKSQSRNRSRRRSCVASRRCGSAWLWLRERALALKPCRVAIVLVFAGLAFLLVAAQGEDVARALAERRSTDPYSWQVFWFFTASLAWSLSAWYWARVMLSLKLPGVPEPDPRLDRLRTWTPRLLGFLATLGVAAAFYQASQGYQADEHQDVKELLRSYAFWCAMGAVAFLVAVSVRRKVARAVSGKLNIEALNLPRSEEQVYGALDLQDLGVRDALAASRHDRRRRGAFRSHGVRGAKRGAGARLGRDRAARGRRRGSRWRSTLDFIGMRLRFPVFSALLAMAVVFSFWNDNHEVRTLVRGAARETPQRARAPARVARRGTMPRSSAASASPSTW